MDVLNLETALQQLQEGSLSSATLVSQMIARADEEDGELGVYVSRFNDAALAAASRADDAARKGESLGALHGIPLGVKDLISSREGQTTAQSRALEPDWCTDDATAVARLRGAGAIILGKTSTMEFAYGIPSTADRPFPFPANPWDRTRWAGGSSSGTGAGTAAGLMLGGLGTDTAGSIRVPAAMCGVTGFKPTYGLVPTDGVVPVGFTADYVGPIAHSAEGCALLFAVLAGRPLASQGPSLDGVRVGVERHARTRAGGDPAVEDLLDGALAVFESLGAQLIEVELPLYEEVTDSVFMTTECEAFAYHRPRLASRWQDYGASVRLGLARGAYYSATDYIQAQRVRRRGQDSLARLFLGLDLVVSPTASVVAPKLDEIDKCMASWKELVHTTYWDAVGNPVLSVPMGFSSQGLPMGMQIAGRPFEDENVLLVGKAFQQATDWHMRSPVTE